MHSVCLLVAITAREKEIKEKNESSELNLFMLSTMVKSILNS